MAGSTSAQDRNICSILCKGRAPNRVNFYCGMLVYIIQRHSDCYHVYVERTQSCTGIQLTGHEQDRNDGKKIDISVLAPKHVAWSRGVIDRND